MNSKLIINSTQIPNYILDEVMPQVGDTEFKILMVICRQTYGWHKESDQISYSQLIEKTGRYKEAVAKGLRSLRESGLILVTDHKGKVLKTREECIGKDLFYKISLTSSKTEPHLFGNRSSEIEHTKETYTKTITNVIDRNIPKRSVSCPLSKSPLKEKYPRGHVECAEYVTSFKFVNKGKQFKNLHNMLRSGLDFAAIDRILVKVENKPFYKENGWDFATLASEADRSSHAS